MSWFVLCYLNYLQNDRSHKKVGTCSLCLWSLTSVNLLSALNGCEGSMKIMKECVCLLVFSGKGPLTVCVFCVLSCECGRVHTHVWRTSVDFSDVRQPVCPLVSVTEGVWGMRGGDIQWQTGQWPHSAEMNPVERGMRPGTQLLNHTDSSPQSLRLTWRAHSDTTFTLLLMKTLRPEGETTHLTNAQMCVTNGKTL